MSRGERVLAVAERLGDDVAMRASPLMRRDLGARRRRTAVLRLEPGRGRELDVVLAERREHLVDVAQEDRVRPDEQHAPASRRRRCV